MGRRSSRFRVCLTVRYSNASEFVKEYAQNLSAGGLFLAGVTDLEPLSEVTVEVELPGYGSFRVQGEVAHVLDEATADRLGRSPGAGLAIKKATGDYKEALHAYLQRLGRRVDHLVLVRDTSLRADLALAGYQVGPAPEPNGLVMAVARSEQPILGIVVPPAEGQRYRDAATDGGDPDLVVVGSAGQLDRVLSALDEKL